MSFKDFLPEAVLPREKLMARGAAALGDAELIALLLRTGMRGKNVLQLAQELLDAFGGLHGLLHAGIEDLKCIKGLGGTAKRAELMAVLEIARRAMGQRMKERDCLDSVGSVKKFLQLHLATRPREVFAVVFLDAKNRLIAMEEMFQGTLTQTSVYPREVVKGALDHRAASVVLAHNHPSGSVEPSHADATLTRTLKSALALIDVQVLDHVIVAPGQALSMAEYGMI
jgi:DNA repair protein RadC